MSFKTPLELKDIGNSYIKSGDVYKAIESYTEALHHISDDKALQFLLYSNRSYSNIILGNLSDSFYDSCKAIEVDPTHFKGYLRRSNVFAEYSLFNQSIKDIEKAINLATKQEEKENLNKRLQMLQKMKEEFEDTNSLKPVKHIFNIFTKKDNNKPDYFKEGQYILSRLINKNINMDDAIIYGENFFDRKWLIKEDVEHLLPKMISVFNSDSKKSKNNILHISAKKVTVLGNIDGNIGQLYAFFDTNGYPNKENVYIINGNFIGQNDFRIIFILFLIKLADPSSIYFTKGAFDLTSKMIKSIRTPNYIKVAYASLDDAYGSNITRNIIDIIHGFPLCIVVNDKIAVMNGGPPLNQESIFGQFSEFISPNSKLNQIKGYPMFSFGEEAVNQFLEENEFSCLINSNRSCKDGFEWFMNGRYVNTSFGKNSQKFGYVTINDTNVEAFNFEFNMFPLEIHSESDQKNFRGIFYHMRKYMNKSPDITGLIDISSTLSTNNEVSYIIDYSLNDFDFMTFPVKNPWVLLDFKNRKIKVEKYIIESMNINPGNDHMKTWILEASNDLENWIIIDSRKDVDELNGPLYAKMFDVNCNEFYRYIKLVQTERNHRGLLNLDLHHIDFFGIVQ